MRIGILTGGGDCPGLNAAIRAVVRTSIIRYGSECTGILEGWRGLLDPPKTMPLPLSSVSGIIRRGGTILKTSRTNPYKRENGAEQVRDTFKSLGLDALVAIGGEDTLGVADKLFREHRLPVVGVPKTIDNDLPGTDFTFGFDTAINIALDAIDRVHTTAESHERVMVVEVMGRHAGWIGLYSGIGGGADVILLPERPFDLDEVCTIIKKRHEGGKDFSIVVVSEGAKLKVDEDVNGSFVLQKMQKDEFGHVVLGGIGNVLAKEIEDRTGVESRVVVLGHIQRGGSPTAYDRFLATRFGYEAAVSCHEGRFGTCMGLRGEKIVPFPLSKAVAELKTVPDHLVAMTDVFIG